MEKIISYSFIVCMALWLTGCATTPRPEKPSASTNYPEPERQGVYHKVKKGQTLWRIARAYGVSINDVISANSIPNVAQVEESQLIFIPGAYAVKDIPMATSEDQNDFMWPLKGKVTSYFHDRRGNWVNKGIDIQTQEGEMVKAARSGEVVFADYFTGHGRTIVIDHTDGYYSVYAQNAKLLVRLNDKVTRGQPIALVGRNGEDVFLSFQIRKKSIEQNPLYFLP